MRLVESGGLQQSQVVCDGHHSPEFFRQSNLKRKLGDSTKGKRGKEETGQDLSRTLELFLR